MPMAIRLDMPSARRRLHAKNIAVLLRMLGWGKASLSMHVVELSTSAADESKAVARYTPSR
jgi:hypothetical protein